MEGSDNLNIISMQGSLWSIQQKGSEIRPIVKL